MQKLCVFRNYPPAWIGLRTPIGVSEHPPVFTFMCMLNMGLRIGEHHLRGCVGGPQARPKPKEITGGSGSSPRRKPPPWLFVANPQEARPTEVTKKPPDCEPSGHRRPDGGMIRPGGARRRGACCGRWTSSPPSHFRFQYPPGALSFSPTSRGWG